MCAAEGRITAANVVDHIAPHRGDPALFWDQANWQPLCKLHHDSAKHSHEMTGRERGCDEHGVPIDAQHPWRD